MQRVCSVPLFKGPIWERAKKFLVIIPKVVISLLKVSRGIIPFEEQIAAVGTTSNDIFSKRKTLDEGSL